MIALTSAQAASTSSVPSINPSEAKAGQKISLPLAHQVQVEKEGIRSTEHNFFTPISSDTLVDDPHIEGPLGIGVESRQALALYSGLFKKLSETGEVVPAFRGQFWLALSLPDPQNWRSVTPKGSRLLTDEDYFETDIKSGDVQSYYFEKATG